MAYWGEAMSLLRQLVRRPQESDLKRGWELIQRAQAIGAKTQRERDYIDALALFYRDYDKVDFEKRVETYSRAMDKVHEEMLGDMLLEMGRPQAALVEYERSMKVDPNRPEWAVRSRLCRGAGS